MRPLKLWTGVLSGFVPVGAALFFYLVYPRYLPLDPWPFFVATLWQSAPLLAALFMVVFSRFPGAHAADRRVWVGFLTAASAGIVVGVFGFQVYWNGAKDRGEIFRHETRVVSKSSWNGKHKKYFLQVESWRGGQETEELAVKRGFYENAIPGKTLIRVATRPGALDREWIVSVSEVRGERNVDASKLDTEAAYRRLGVARSLFDSSRTSIDGLESAYLERMLGLCEQAMLARMTAMDKLYLTGGDDGQLLIYEARMTELSSMTVPPRLAGVRRLVLEAMAEQFRFLQTWTAKRKQWFWPKFNEPEVRSSSAKLIQAYNELMRLYPSENASNQRAFHDTLCALDFI